MCPFAIDNDKMHAGSPERLLSLDPAKPPVKSIPHMEFPRVVYKHPNEPFLVIEHRNSKHELVEEEIIPAEHLSKVLMCREHEIEMEQGAKQSPPRDVLIANCRKCEAALEEALAEGWVLKPYVPEAVPDKRAALYETKLKEAKSKRQQQAS